MSKPKYRIRKVASANGDRYYAEKRGLLWGWNQLPYRVIDGKVSYWDYSVGSMSQVHCKQVIDFCVNQDNERETIIDYP